MKLLVFGRGYSASHFLRTHSGGFRQISATTRGLVRPGPIEGVEDLVFDGIYGNDEVRSKLAEVEALLISIPAGTVGDPVLKLFHDEISGATCLKTIVYLSTIGVYGDHGGRWVDESTLPVPQSDRSKERLRAEQGWQSLAASSGKHAHILRLAGIYGPGQNALENLRAGTARPIIKQGQVFNRIHVEDIARAIAAAFAHKTGGVWNVSDNEPAPPQDVIAFAAKLAGLEPPKAIAFEDAPMTPMGRSFYSENKRVSNKRLREELGVVLAFPTYREGIAALAQTYEG